MDVEGRWAAHTPPTEVRGVNLVSKNLVHVRPRACQLPTHLGSQAPRSTSLTCCKVLRKLTPHTQVSTSAHYHWARRAQQATLCSQHGSCALSPCPCSCPSHSSDCSLPGLAWPLLLLCSPAIIPCLPASDQKCPFSHWPQMLPL